LLGTGLVALQVLLAAVCLYLGWTTVAALLHETPVAVAQIEAPAAAPTSRPDIAHYAAIGQRDLFRTASFQKPVDAPPQPEAEDLAESSLRVRLFATAATDPPEASLASIEDLLSGETVNVRVGDTVQGAEIRRIERRRIVVENRGRLEEIVFDEEESGAAAVPARVSRAALRPAVAARAGRPTRRVADAVRDLTRRTRQQRTGAPQSPAASALRKAEPVPPTPEEQAEIRAERQRMPFFQVNVQPEWDGRRIVGFKLKNVPPGSELGSAGLRPDDVVRTVNGTRIEQVGDDHEAAQALLDGSAFTLEVERGGQTFTVEVGD